MPVHQTAAFVNAGLPAVVGMIKLDIVCHRIGIRLDNAGDDEQQRPQEREKRRHKADEERSAEIVLKATEHIAQLHGLMVARLLEENICHTIFQRTDYKQCADAGDNAGGSRLHQTDQQAHGQPHHPEVLKNTAAELRSCAGF